MTCAMVAGWGLQITDAAEVSTQLAASQAHVESLKVALMERDSRLAQMQVTVVGSPHECR